MKIIHHGQRPQSTCWLCPGSNARVLGWESHTQGQCQRCSNPQEVCSALSWGPGSLLVTTGVLVPPTFASSPSEALSRVAGGHSKAVSMRMGCFSPLLW